MALSNRDRVGRAFEQLALGLGPYVDERMRVTSRVKGDWFESFVRSARPPIHGDASRTDPALLMRIIAEAWETGFRPVLTRADRNLVFELRDVRNRWAHNDSFSIDDAYRALDSIERLLISVGAADPASEVGASKGELMEARWAQQAKSAAATPIALLTEPTAGMRPWREVIVPHDDVARGRFQLAEFAADLSLVAAGQGTDEYRLPDSFFQRTFITEGLRSLLTEAVQRIAGTGGSPVVDLQTTFGGGKTHSMIALYHLFSGRDVSELPKDIADLVDDAGVDALPEVRRAVLVGTDLKPGQPTDHDGTAVNTMWGELAWKLGGAEGYALVADADRTSTNPGDALRELLARYSPCLILVDEWVAYARGLYADDKLVGGTFDTHFTFAQSLTEAARATPGALLVVSLPAPASTGEVDDQPPIGSEHEVGGAGGRETLRRLRAVVGRMESSWRPATAEESFEIVRRRLFQDLDEEALAHRDATAKKFAALYRKQADEFPAECRESAYEERIKKAYPIHPELFARLYEDWSTLERFQRTRGVLRLMANVVQALWASGDQSPLILPALVPLSDATVVTELTRNLEDAWKPIIDTDVDGESSLPRALDTEIKNLGRYGAARRVARTVFLGSAPLAGTPNQGIDAARVRLGCAVPGDSVAIYADALNRLADRGTYFFAANGRYWYGTQPGLSRLARDRAERLLAHPRNEIHDHIVSQLDPRRNPNIGLGDFAAVHSAPESPADVSDVASARLVILGPEHPHRARAQDSRAERQAAAILESRGSALRDFRNMLVFLAADERGVEDLEHAVAELLSWSSIVSEADDLGLSGHQLGQAKEREQAARDAVELQVAGTYIWLIVPQQHEVDQPLAWEALKSDGPGTLAGRASDKLRFGGELYLDYPRDLLRLKLQGPLASLWEDGAVTVEALWDAYARYLYLHRIKDVGAFCESLRTAPSSMSWELDGVGLAETRQPDGRFGSLIGGEAALSVRGSTLVVKPEIAALQLAEERAADPMRPDDEEFYEQPEPAVDDAKRRFHGSVRLDPSRLAVQAGRLNTEVLSHLHALEGTDMEITIEIRAVRSDGFPSDIMRVVDENAAALRFDDHGFETN